MTWWNPNQYLITEALCFKCNKKLTKLSKCGRCQCAYYCNQKCQKLDYPNHKTFCLQYKQLNITVNKERKILENDKHEKYFEPETIGHFWGLFDPRNYCRAKYALGEHILVYAQGKETAKLYENGLAHYMELLRLIHGDNMGIRDQVPFILLKLNRDNDAYNFIKWWVTIDPEGRYDWGDPPQSAEGDWLYLTDQNINEDLLKTKKKSHLQFFNLGFLAALYLIKMRTILRLASIDVQMKEVKRSVNFLKSSEYIIISDIIHLYLTGTDGQNIDTLVQEQRNHAQMYLDQMLTNNKVFVQSLINPDPLREMSAPNGYSQGSGEEAYLVMYRCWRMFDRTPGAKEMIIQKVGEYPQYTPEFMSLNW